MGKWSRPNPLKIKMEGREFGWLTVIGESPRNTQGRARWLICECRCGSRLERRGDDLRRYSELGLPLCCPQCRPKRERKPVTNARLDPPRKPQPNPCPDGCCGMSWRVVGRRCRSCGLARMPERRPVVTPARESNLARGEMFAMG